MSTQTELLPFTVEIAERNDPSRGRWLHNKAPDVLSAIRRAKEYSQHYGYAHDNGRPKARVFKGHVPTPVTATLLIDWVPVDKDHLNWLEALFTNGHDTGEQALTPRAGEKPAAPTPWTMESLKEHLRLHPHQTIEVTAEDIAHGQRQLCHACPIALAVGRLFPLFEVSAGRFIYLSTPTDAATLSERYTVASAITPTRARAFMGKFDNEEPVKPFSFTASFNVYITRS